MTIKFKTHPAPTIEPQIQEALDNLDGPRVFMIWNARSVALPDEAFEGRWEIWCELMDVSHPDAKHLLDPSRDRWNTDAQCWMRFLQTYTTAEGDYAPADWGLVIGLELADTWKNRRFYEEKVEAPYDAFEVTESKARQEIFTAGADYYKDLDRTAVGAYANSGWRHRIR